MRDLKLAVGYILVILGWALLVGANITAIGVGLYDWAFNTTLALAAWGAFVLWLKMLGGGIVSLIVGLVLGEGRVK
jgi:hypothetical protein